MLRSILTIESVYWNTLHSSCPVPHPPITTFGCLGNYFSGNFICHIFRYSWYVFITNGGIHNGHLGYGFSSYWERVNVDTDEALACASLVLPLISLIVFFWNWL